MFTYRFADPAELIWLWLLPVLTLLWWWNWRRTQRRLQVPFSPTMIQFLTRSVSLIKRRIKWGLQLTALALFVVALARPQSGEGRQKAKSEGLEMMIAIDVSNSMMAEDVRPSRLDLAKKELARLVDSLGGDKVGLVAFAGSAVLLTPMTTDKGALKMFIESLSVETVGSQGTDFKKAIHEAQNALMRGGSDGEASGATRVIVIASDGEENEKGGLDAAKKAAEEGIRIFTLGFGTSEGGQIPVRDQTGNLVGYKKDENQKVIVTKSTGEALKALADAGQGEYQHVTYGSDAIQHLKSRIGELQKAEFDTMEVSHYDELYQWFLLAGLLIAFVDLSLGTRKREGRIWRGRFEKPLD